MTTRFSGESPWDAVVNDNSLDIEEEADFLDFCRAKNCGKDSPLEVLELLYGQWRGEGSE